MRAQIIRRFGAPDVFEPVELPDPRPGPGEVLVQVAAAGINPVDYKLRRAGPQIAPDLPAVLGCDAAGTVVAVGEGVAAFREGDEVYGCAGGVRGMPGSYAEKIAADERLLAHKPKSLAPREAAALPLVTITAWEGLYDRAGLKAGQTVLVHGGTGGVSHVALQLAKARGATVFATVSSGHKAEIARRLGADATVNYREETVEGYVERLTNGVGFDVVFDATGGDQIDRSLAAAGLNGGGVTITGQDAADLSPMHVKGLSLHVVFMLIPMLHGVGRERHGDILRRAAMMVEASQLTPLLDEQRFGLDDVAAAHRRLESGEALGKVVVDVG